MRSRQGLRPAQPAIESEEKFIVKVFCGIDYSERHYDVALIDAEGKLVAKRRIAESADSFTELMSMLADTGDSREAPLPVATPP